MRNFASTLVKFSKLSHIQTTIWRPPKMAPPRTAGLLRHCHLVDLLGHLLFRNHVSNFFDLKPPPSPLSLVFLRVACLVHYCLVFILMVLLMHVTYLILFYLLMIEHFYIFRKTYLRIRI